MSYIIRASRATQQKAQLLDPFVLSDSQILDKVCPTHLRDDDKCDKDTLFNIVSNVLLKTRLPEGRSAAASFRPEFRTLKLISCQMITAPSGVHYVDRTTMWILQHLKTFSWHAKALVTVAAFALEYGNLAYLTETRTSDTLANSLKHLNQVQTRKVPPAAATLVTVVMEALQHIRECETRSAARYDTEEVPSLSDASKEIPLVLYWTLASLVACTANIVVSSDYILSDFTDRLSFVVNKKDLTDYLRRERAFLNPKDVVDFLKLLIHRSGSPTPQVFDGSTKTITDIEVFRYKYVLLFFSGLSQIDIEIKLLNSIYVGLEKNPKEVKEHIKKEDFKILWIPVVDDWDDKLKMKFITLKNHFIKWYAVEYFSKLQGIRLIREKLNYCDKPIMPMLDPLGNIMNEDAMEVIFQWGIDAFPFRKIDADNLIQKWKWFWDITKKVNLGIDVKGGRYIFIYGGTVNKWLMSFALALEKMKRHRTIFEADARIEHYQLGKNDPKVVPRFWIEIESKEPLDSEIQEIVKSLLCLKQDPQGWVILSKGPNVKLLGHGEPMYQTVAEFERWKEKVNQKEDFDIAFREYYEAKLKETEMEIQPCSDVSVDNYTAKVTNTITRRKLMICEQIRRKIHKICRKCCDSGGFMVD